MGNTVKNLQLDNALSTVYTSSRWLYPLENDSQFIAGDLNVYKNAGGKMQYIDKIVVSSDIASTARISAVTQDEYDAADKDPSTLYIITAEI